MQGGEVYCGRARCVEFLVYFAMVGFVMQMRLLPSVQPFHAIAYPIDSMLALEIR